MTKSQQQRKRDKGRSRTFDITCIITDNAERYRKVAEAFFHFCSDQESTLSVAPAIVDELFV